MKKKICFLLIYILFCPLIIYSQKVEIIKDTVCQSGECFVLQELKITKSKIYNKIQTTHNLFDNNEIFTDWKDRLNYKKKVFKDCKSFDELREIQYGFEDYEIYFNSNNLLYISTTVTAYGYPNEYTYYLLLDLKKDEEVGIKLLKNKKKLFKVCLKKIKEKGYTEFRFDYNNLFQYRIDIDKNGEISNIYFLFDNPENDKDPNYIDFSFIEIKPFIKSKYLKYFKQ